MGFLVLGLSKETFLTGISFGGLLDFKLSGPGAYSGRGCEFYVGSGGLVIPAGVVCLELLKILKIVI